MLTLSILVRKGNLSGKTLLAECEKGRYSLNVFPKTKEYKIITDKMEKAVKERMFSIELYMGLGDFDYKIIKYYFTPYGYRVFLYDDNINIDWSGADFDESLLDFIK